MLFYIWWAGKAFKIRYIRARTEGNEGLSHRYIWIRASQIKRTASAKILGLGMFEHHQGDGR